MNISSKKTSHVILGITAIACSKVLFFLFNDPEGANLLIVVVMALILYFLSLSVYAFKLQTTPTKKLLIAVCIQILLVGVFYAFLG